MISLICDIAGEAILYGLGRFIDYAIRQNQNSIGRRQEARTSKADNCDSFNLTMAGVPAEPAVARKTGITKDLGRALPMMVYVFHCSEQMDFRAVDGNRCEYEVIMRALRKLTTQKIVTEDTTLFMGLVGDLFIALDVPRTRELEFENQIRQAMVDLKLQHKNNFILKVVKLVELLEVKHSVFIISVTGTGKTELWQTLYRTHANLKFKPYLNDIEPNAVTDDELFGVINPTTKGCVDKLFSCLIREQSQMSVDGSKLMILDEMLQKILEKPLEKKAGKNFCLPDRKTLIHFIDDINMPEGSSPENEYLISTLIHSHFADGIGDQKCIDVRSWLILQTLLKDAMKSYSEFLGVLDLVHLEDAMSRVWRIRSQIVSPIGGFKAMKKLPKHIGNYHPVQLLNELIPGIRYWVTVIANPPSDILVKCRVYGLVIVGRASTKKAAQRQIAIKALAFFFGVRFNN
eukprot:XP_016663228.1 PREDICTED: dynein beta chain, ciliary-like [Acyrthosiphon pisum]